MNVFDYLIAEPTGKNGLRTPVTTDFTIFKENKPSNLTKNHSNDFIINNQTKTIYNDSPNTNFVLTPPSSIGKKILTSLKSNKPSQANFIQKGLRNFGNQKEEIFNKKYKRQIPAPLNLSGVNICINNKHIQDFEKEAPLIAKSKMNLEPQLLKLTLKENFVIDTNYRALNKLYENKNSTSTKSRKNYKNETCVICKELLRISLAEEKPVFMKTGGLAHFDCFATGINTMDDNKNYPNQTTDSYVSTETSVKYLSEKSSFQNTSSCYSSTDTKKTELLIVDVTTPVNQILPKENFNKNGFNNKNIKQTHQEFKNRDFSDDNFTFDISICPQFYKFDLLETSKRLSLPYVINLRNKENFEESENNKLKAMLNENSNLYSELLIKKEITKEFGFHFPKFFKTLENSTFQREDIVIDMIDVIDLSTDGNVYKPFIIIFISKIGYLMLLSVETNYSFSIDLKFLYKVMRLEDFVLIYLKSLTYPEIYFKIPFLKTPTSITDSADVLNKWSTVLNWKIQNLPISYNLKLLSTNLFDINASDFAYGQFNAFLAFFVNKIPGDIAKKEVDITIKKVLDCDSYMPIKANDLAFSKCNDSVPKSFCENNEDRRIVCLVVNTDQNIHETIKILLEKLETNCLIGFIVANGDKTFKYIGFVNSKWDGLSEFLETLVIEKNSISLKICNLDNMFMKIDELLKLKGIAANDYIDIKIFNDQEIGTEVKYFKKIVKKYSNLTIYNYDIDLNTTKFETFMEENFQFSNNYFKLAFQKLDDISNELILNQCQKNKTVCLNLLINPDFQECVSIKTFENTFGHKVFIENYKNIKDLQINLKNEVEFKLIIIDLEIIDVKKFIQKVQDIENSYPTSNEKQALIFYKINNATTVYKSNEICFNIIQKNSSLDDTAIINLKLSSERESDEGQSLYESDVSSGTTDLLISTPISSNKEPFYLLRDIELQLITILEEVLLKGKKNNPEEKTDIVNYYYTVFFSNTKYIDIKDHGNNNFAYDNINEFIDCLFDILLSNDQTKIALVYNMLKYQYRNDIKLLIR